MKYQITQAESLKAVSKHGSLEDAVHEAMRQARFMGHKTMVVGYDTISTGFVASQGGTVLFTVGEAEDGRIGRRAPEEAKKSARPFGIPSLGRAPNSGVWQSGETFVVQHGAEQKVRPGVHKVLYWRDFDGELLGLEKVPAKTAESARKLGGNTFGHVVQAMSDKTPAGAATVFQGTMVAVVVDGTHDKWSVTATHVRLVE